jgi:hypothetical protein
LSDVKIVSTETKWDWIKSDHAAVIACFKGKDTIPTNRNRNRLYLDPCILDTPERAEELRREFHNLAQQVTDIEDKHTRLEFIKMALRTAASEVNKRHKKSRKEQMEQVQQEINNIMDNMIDMEEKDQNYVRLSNKLNVALMIRNSILEEKGQELARKTKTRWYEEGERSTKYFLNLLKRKSKLIEVKELDDDGTTLTDQAEIETKVVNYYRELYNQRYEDPENDEYYDILPTVTQEKREELMRPITLRELKETLKTMTDSAPGPDGISYSFIKAVWDDFGPTLLESWEDSLRTGRLPDSHRKSMLKLIPKVGKNLKDLKNWRPITLSNCDLKIITKCLSQRLTKAVSEVISKTQTAYMKGRQIHENIRLIKSAVHSRDKGTSRLVVVALDARKAFDSVKHDHIRAILSKIGLQEFIPLFNLLYKDIETDIILNGTTCKGYSINNGVKQGDALSCILFILAMEPLIRHIELNQRIPSVQNISIDFKWPKAYGYADDINIMTSFSAASIRNIFTEYGEFTRYSGLTLNADKTEIFSSEPAGGRTVGVTYLNTRYDLELKDKINLNGVSLCTDINQMRMDNADVIKHKIRQQLEGWLARGLCLMGKIQIIKTFGISQILYKNSSLDLGQQAHKEIRTLIYKFLWGKSLAGNKAPDRIARHKICADVLNGGFGLHDHELICDSVNIKQILRNLEENFYHPLGDLLRKIFNSSYYNPQVQKNYDCVAEKALEQIKALRSKTILNTPKEIIATDNILLTNVKEEKISHICKNKRALPIRLFEMRGITKVKQVPVHDLTVLANELENHTKMVLLEYKRLVTNGHRVPNDRKLLVLPKDMGYIDGKKIESKKIRSLITGTENVIASKLPLVSTELATKNYFKRVKRLTSVRQINTLLRIYHGDIYCHERMHKMRLTESDECPRCHQVENREHLILTCQDTIEMWTTLNRILGNQARPTIDSILGIGDKIPVIKLKAEILGVITRKERLEHIGLIPIRMAVARLAMVDKSKGMKKLLKKVKDSEFYTV